MKEKKEKKKGSFGFLGLDPTLGIGDKVLDYVEDAHEEAKAQLAKSDYYAMCPSCGRKQIMENLLESGCFICGWKGTEEELELANAKRSFGISVELDEKEEGYKMKCPNCNATVVTEEFKKNGCWRCGYRN